MYNSQEIANRIKLQAKQNGKPLAVLLSECGLGKNTVSKISNGTDILTLNFVKIADSLDCSVDYFLGRDGQEEKPAPKDRDGPSKTTMIFMEHSQIILNALQERNISAYKLAKETGISESLFSKWKKKPTSDIASSNLARIAEYLDCSVDSLLGRDIQKEKPVPKDRDGPGETTQQFVRLVNKLTPEQQQLLLAQLQAWTEQNQQQALAVPRSDGETGPESAL